MKKNVKNMYVMLHGCNLFFSQVLMIKHRTITIYFSYNMKNLILRVLEEYYTYASAKQLHVL